jgi:hypothetical protein
MILERHVTPANAGDHFSGSTSDAALVVPA